MTHVYQCPIKAIAAKHGAPIGSVRPDGSLNARERNAGLIGRLFLHLADDSPGWREKDNPAGRSRLREEVRQYLATHKLRVSVRIQAAYSELGELPDGSIARRDSAGRIIGVYGPGRLPSEIDYTEDCDVDIDSEGYDEIDAEIDDTLLD